MSTDDHERIIFLEATIWGKTGRNGLVGEVRGMRRELEEYIETERLRRAKDEETERQERKRDRRWRIGTSIAIVTAILMAASIVASAL